MPATMEGVSVESGAMPYMPVKQNRSTECMCIPKRSGKASPTNRISALLYLVIGFQAVSAQIFFLRELLVVFQGNELSLGFSLACWLVWTAAGSILGGRILPGWKPERLLGAGFLAAGLLLPVTQAVIRLSRQAAQSVQGELIGPLGILAISFLLLGPICSVMGGLFSLSSRLELSRSGRSAAVSTGTVYLFEAVGSGFGGVTAGFLLVPFLNPVQSALLVSLPAWFAAACFLTRERRKIVIPIVSMTAAGLLMAAPVIESALNRILWDEFEFIAVADSRYSRITLVRRDHSTSLYLNGIVSWTIPDAINAEETVHFALLEHPEPKTLLLIGGGLGGGLYEALKHPSLKHIDYVELDSRVLNLVSKYLPGAGEVFQREEIDAHWMDGRRFLKKTSKKFDVVIVSVPEPLTAQLNRFYTVEFFHEVEKKLNPGGLFSFSIEGSENYISEDLAVFVQVLVRSLEEVFPETVVLPGPVFHFIAAGKGVGLSTNSEWLLQRLESRGLETKFVNENFLPYRLSAHQLDQLSEVLKSGRRVKVNRDFFPVAYLARSRIWFSMFFRLPLKEWIGRLEKSGFEALWAAVVGLVLLAAVLIRFPLKPSQDRVRRITALSAIFFTGISGISIELLLLLGFQVIYGYVYYQLILLIGFFMFGVGAGGWLVLRRGLTRDPRKVLAVLTGISVFLPFILVLLLQALSASDLSENPAAVLFFPTASLAGGILAGMQFPLAGRLFYGSKDRGNVGTVYGIDVVGACAGSVLLSACLLPLYGMSNAAILIGSIGLFPLALIITCPGGNRAE